MRTSSVQLVAVVLFLAVLGQGYAIRCWTCSSGRYREDCEDPFNKTHQQMTNCEEHRSSSSHSTFNIAVCKKIKYRENEGSELITMRKCDWVSDHSYDNKDKIKSDCSATSTPSHWKVEYCNTCTQDGCNGSYRGVVASAWCALVPLVVYLLSKKAQ